MHNEPPQQPPNNAANPLPIDLSLIGQSEKIESKANDKASIDLAKKEVEYQYNDGERGESYKQHIHRIVVSGMYVIGSLMLILIFVRAWHFFAPECWRWLSEKDQHNIERIVFSGIIVTLASKYFKKYKVIEE